MLEKLIKKSKAYCLIEKKLEKALVKIESLEKKLKMRRIELDETLAELKRHRGLIVKLDESLSNYGNITNVKITINNFKNGI